MFKKLTIIALTILATEYTQAQEIWTLERCVVQAQEMNRTVKQSQVAVKNAKLTNKQDQYAVYPTVNANSNLGFNFGRSVNPATYTFENTSSTYNSWSLSGSAVLYNGGRLKNQIKQSANDIKAAEADLEQTAQGIALQVAQAYLQILLNEEQLKNVQRRLQTTQEQLTQTDRRIKAGALAANARLDIVAQVARDEQAIVTAQNNVELSYLTLKNLMEFPLEREMKIETPSVIVPSDINPDGFMFKAVYNQALGAQPQIRAGELRIRSAEIGVKIAEAGLLPSLFANANLGSNYSNKILDIAKGKKGTVEVPQVVKIGTQVQTVFFTQPTLTDIPIKSYASQLGDNLGQGIGLQLQIPIFDGFQRRIAVDRQKLNVESQTIALDRNKQQLKSDVQTAIANAKAAKKQFEAAQRTFEALKAAFDATEKRLATGGANGFEYTQARSNVDNAERDVTVAKFDYLFKVKIVEFYEGKKLTLR
jgi:outer membrane protein